MCTRSEPVSATAKAGAARTRRAGPPQGQSPARGAPDVGPQRRGPYARGQRFMALYACMYFAALRPAEAVGLRLQDCYLPETGWGRLTLEKSRPEVNRRWTDTTSAHDERGLKMPVPQDLVKLPDGSAE
jgi:hypothetical protein